MELWPIRRLITWLLVPCSRRCVAKQWRLWGRAADGYLVPGFQAKDIIKPESRLDEDETQVGL
ncbi:hypothetical protein [Desulfobacula sp.]